MKILLNAYNSNLLVQSKVNSNGQSFNQLLTEAMEYLHNKYNTKEQYAQEKSKQESS